MAPAVFGLFLASCAAPARPARPSPSAPEEALRAADEAPRRDVLHGHLRVPAVGEITDGEVVSEVAIEPGEWPPSLLWRWTELYVLGSGDLGADAVLLEPAMRVEGTSEVGALHVVWLGDSAPSGDAGSLRILAGLSEHPDGTLQRFSFHFAPRLSEPPEEATARARGLLARTVPGPDLLRGPARVAFEGFSIDVPAGYAYVRWVPADRQLSIQVRRLRRAGEPSAILSFHAGPAPAYPFPPPRGATPVAGTLLGAEVEWHLSVGPDCRSIETELRRGSLRVRIHVISSSEEDEEALRAIAESLRTE